MTRSASCVRCPTGRYEAGTKTITREKEGTTLVVKDVPAHVCDKCGEAYLDADVSRELTQMLNDAIEAGADEVVRTYDAKAVA